MKADFKRDRETRRWFGTLGYEAGVDPGLRPCPFCGEAKNLSVHGVSFNACYFVRCGECGTDRGTDDLSEVKVNNRTRAAFEAAHREGFAAGIAAWNRRSDGGK